MHFRSLFLVFVQAYFVFSQTNNNYRCSNIDLGILMDSSGSITNPQGISPWTSMLEFVTFIISRLNLGQNLDYVGLVQFSDRVQVVANLTTYLDKSTYYESVNELYELNGNTYTGLGLSTLRTVTFAPGNGDRPNIPNMAIVITDGRSNVDIPSTSANANMLKNSGVTVFVIGVTNEVSLEELNQIASLPQNIFLVNDYLNLTDLDFVNRVMSSMCRPTARPADCQKKMDLAFILDESSSVTFRGALPWTRDLLGFTADVIKYFNISTIDTKVGIVKFASTAQVAVGFNDVSSLSQLLPIVYKLQNSGGETDLSSGLRVAREQLFSDRRTNAVQIAILITDGAANVKTDRTFPEAELLKNSGVEIFCLGITPQVNITELQLIVSRPNITHFFQLDYYDQLSRLLGNITRSVCNSQGVTPLPTLSTSPLVPTTTSRPGTCTALNCAICFNSSYCISCYSGFYLNTLTLPPTCSACMDNCLRCSSQFVCDSCNPPFVWNPNAIPSACQILCLSSVLNCVRCSPAVMATLR